MDYEDSFILDCLAILCERINACIIKKGWENFLDFIKEVIRSGYYVYTIVETSKISVYDKGGIGLHHFLIYGYDDLNGYVYSTDCFKNGKYAFEKISYSELSESLPYDKKGYEDIFVFHNDIMLLKANPKFHLHFQPTRVKKSLEDYMESKPSQYIFGRLRLEYPDEINCYLFEKIVGMCFINIYTMP